MDERFVVAIIAGLLTAADRIPGTSRHIDDNVDLARKIVRSAATRENEAGECVGAPLFSRHNPGCVMQVAP
jgi:hypothetical protein